MKKTLNIFELLIQIGGIVLLWVDGMYLALESTKNYMDVEPNIPISFMDAADGTPLGLFLIALFALNAVLCLISVFNSNDKRDGVLHCILPVINLVVFIILSIANDKVKVDNDAIFRQPIVVVQVSTMFTVMIFVLFAIAVIAFAKRSRTVVPAQEENPVTVNNIQEVSTADELAKYKKLLDEKIITQEEFDAKKKQLLGL